MASKNEEKKMTVEEAFAVIDEKIKALEDENITLEESFAQYKEGMDLLKYCHDEVAKVEQQVQRITEDGRLEEFE
jgi:exodeoxyribonuclease VII small subunit